MTAVGEHDVLAQAIAWKHAGHDVALATVIKTWGSSPRPAGSQLIVRRDAQFQGSVSGGCVEGRVVEEALDILGGAPPRTLTFGVRNEEAWEHGLACGGTIRVHVGGDVALSTLEAVTAAQRDKRPVVLVTDLETGARRLLEAGGGANDEERDAVRRALRGDRCQLIAERHFLQPFNPPLRLMIVGGVHVAQLLVPMARAAGYDVIVIDPRSAFASEERFPGGVTLDHRWPDEALAGLAVDERTAVVVLTHDPKIDDPALVAALRSSAFYVGALGSRRTHAARRERLAAEGFDDAALDRIHGPIGLNIGARAPAEIAISIIAEVTQVLRRPPGAA